MLYSGRETHQIAAAQQEKNERLRNAFGLSEYEEGTAFDPEKRKLAAERKRRADELNTARKMQEVKR